MLIMKFPPLKTTANLLGFLFAVLFLYPNFANAATNVSANWSSNEYLTSQFTITWRNADYYQQYNNGWSAWTATPSKSGSIDITGQSMGWGPGWHAFYVAGWNGSNWDTSQTSRVWMVEPPPPINGSCGKADGVAYSYGSTGYSPYEQCSSGSPSNASFPSAGSSVSWTCSGSNNGSPSGSCSASQNAATPSTPTVFIAPNPVGLNQVMSVSWSTANATSYNYKVDGITITTVSPTATSISGTPSYFGFTTAGSYKVEVQACNATGCSSYGIGYLDLITAPTISTFTSNSTSLPAGGGPVTLTWSSINTTKCVASNGWSGDKPTSGSQTVSVLSTATYDLTCY